MYKRNRFFDEFTSSGEEDERGKTFFPQNIIRKIIMQLHSCSYMSLFAISRRGHTKKFPISNSNEIHKTRKTIIANG